MSYECPGFHGYCGIPAAPGANNHTPSFTAAASTQKAHELAMATSKGIAIVGWKVLTEDRLAAEMRRDFEEDMASASAGEALVNSVPGGGCC